MEFCQAPPSPIIAVVWGYENALTRARIEQLEKEGCNTRYFFYEAVAAKQALPSCQSPVQSKPRRHHSGNQA
ncbi:Pantothenate transporter liz1 [Fusarium oxysporum f. sp. albedinis]|nr:Pantothenate transporter liz1 [Fusarium oxysporum f. sp. albedinis]